MIIKGTSCAGASRLAKHVTRTDTNERVEVKDIRGTVAEDIMGALREMEGVATGARTTKPFYHASINTLANERMTDEQRTQAIDKLEAALGLTGQPRVVVVHEKKDREHCHIVWSRIDLDRMAAISDSHNYRKHEEVARALEREFGFERVQGAHVERDGKPRPERTPSHREMLQAERTGLGPKEAKDLMTGIWNGTKNGKEFQAGLAEKGWVLARGDRRDFVAIDPSGGVHSIARRIAGVKAADVRQRFADLDPRDLQSVAEARQTQRERHGHRLAGRIGVGLAAAKAALSGHWRQTDNGKQFKAGIESGWWVLAKGDRRDFVAVDIEGGKHNIARRVEGATEADVRRRFADLDLKSLPTVAEAKKLQQARQAERGQQAAAVAVKRAEPEAGHARASTGPRQPAPRLGASLGAGGRTAAKIGGSVFAALMGEKPTPKQKESDASPAAKDIGMPSQHRQELMRQLMRDVPQETERDAELERDRIEKDRGRERSR